MRDEGGGTFNHIAVLYYLKQKPHSCSAAHGILGDSRQVKFQLWKLEIERWRSDDDVQVWSSPK